MTHRSPAPPESAPPQTGSPVSASSSSPESVPCGVSIQPLTTRMRAHGSTPKTCGTCPCRCENPGRRLSACVVRFRMARSWYHTCSDGAFLVPHMFGSRDPGTTHVRIARSWYHTCSGRAVLVPHMLGPRGPGTTHVRAPRSRNHTCTGAARPRYHTCTGRAAECCTSPGLSPHLRTSHDSHIMHQRCHAAVMHRGYHTAVMQAFNFPLPLAV